MDQKELKSFEAWCWRRMEKMSGTVCEERGSIIYSQERINIEISYIQHNWIGHILRRKTRKKT